MISFRPKVSQVVLVGKLDWLFSHVFVQILYRAISEVKCFSLCVICKDGGSDHRTFFSPYKLLTQDLLFLIMYNCENNMSTVCLLEFGRVSSQ